MIPVCQPNILKIAAQNQNTQQNQNDICENIFEFSFSAFPGVPARSAVFPALRMQLFERLNRGSFLDIAYGLVLQPFFCPLIIFTPHGGA